MKRWVAIAGGVVGVGLIGYALLSAESDEEKIRNKLNQLEEAVAVSDPSENVIFRKARMDEAFEEIFTEQVSVSIPELTSLRSGRTRLAGVATKAGTFFSSASVSFDDVDVVIDPAGDRAQVRSEVTLDAVRAGRPRRDTRAVTLQFVKRDDWLIDSIRVAPGSASRGLWE